VRPDVVGVTDVADPPQRQSAVARRERVLDAATHLFAARGLHGTTTADIARQAGISQPYLFRLFGTKMALFLAAADRAYGRMDAAVPATAVTLAAARRCANDAVERGYHAEARLLVQVLAARGEDDVRDLIGRWHAVAGATAAKPLVVHGAALVVAARDSGIQI